MPQAIVAGVYELRFPPALYIGINSRVRFLEMPFDCSLLSLTGGACRPDLYPKRKWIVSIGAKCA